MLDRARQRRENLDKKMAETTTARKRPAIPLSENQESNCMPRKNNKDDGKYSTLKVIVHTVSRFFIAEYVVI